MVYPLVPDGIIQSHIEKRFWERAECVQQHWAGHAYLDQCQRVGPPQKLVYFEKEGIGTVPAFFHDVLVSLTATDEYGLEESGFIVLIYDLRFEQNAARWFPPANDPYQRPWAAQINDDARLYLVHTTGFQYVYDNREYCVLMVERAVTSTGL